MTIVTGTGVVQHPHSDRELRFKDRATRLAVAAAEAALTDAGLLADGALTVPGSDVGTVVSSNLGILDTVCRVAGTLDREGPAALRAVDLPNACSNAAASTVAIRYGLRGVNLTLCNGATSGLDAVGWAAPALETGRTRHVLVVGVEPADAAVRQRAGGAGAFDGAAALVLELAGTAAARGCRPRAVVSGYARRRDGAAAAEAVAHGAGPGLWLPPESGADTGRPPPGAVVHDLGRTLPPASGAFGVLQCVAATAWFDAGTPDGVPPTALAVAGGGSADDAAAAVLLTAAAPHDGVSKGEG